MPYFGINLDFSKIDPIFVGFLPSHWIRVSFPFKKKIFPFLDDREQQPVLVKVVCFPRKFHTSLQANLLMNFLKRKIG